MVEKSRKSNKHAGPDKHVQWKFLPRHKEKLYGKIVNVPNLDNFLLQHLKMSRIKAQNAIWRNKNVDTTRGQPTSELSILFFVRSSL